MPNISTTNYDYEGRSKAAGPLTEPPADGQYRVRFRRLDGARPIRSTLLVLAALLLLGGFLVWLMLPAHWPSGEAGSVIRIASITMTVTTGIIGLFAFLNLATLCRATLLARDPIPVRAAPGHRVAFVTTIVPVKEPIEMVGRRSRPPGRSATTADIDVWLLDEGDDPAVRAMCAALGVHHFTGEGSALEPGVSGRFKAKTQARQLQRLARGARRLSTTSCSSVDPDHVPLPSFAERMLGYFRDPDVAFVVGPQVYGNYDNLVTKCAESQQFLFHG